MSVSFVRCAGMRHPSLVCPFPTDIRWVSKELCTYVSCAYKVDVKRIDRTGGLSEAERARGPRARPAPPAAPSALSRLPADRTGPPDQEQKQGFFLPASSTSGPSDRQQRCASTRGAGHTHVRSHTSYISKAGAIGRFAKSGFERSKVTPLLSIRMRIGCACSEVPEAILWPAPAAHAPESGAGCLHRGSHVGPSSGRSRWRPPRPPGSKSISRSHSRRTSPPQAAPTTSVPGGTT